MIWDDKTDEAINQELAGYKGPYSLSIFPDGSHKVIKLTTDDLVNEIIRIGNKLKEVEERLT